VTIGAALALPRTNAAAAQSAEPVPQPAACVMGQHPEDLTAWARFAADLTCKSLRDKGVQVVSPAPTAVGASTAFTVTLDRLGPKLTLLVSYEAPLGTTRRALWAPMTNFRELDGVVARFVMELTSKVKPVVHAPRATIAATLGPKKPRKPPDRPKKVQWYIGFETGLVAFPAVPGGGMLIGAFFSVEAGHFGVSVRGILAGTSENPMSSIALGGRYYFSRESTSLFLGGGIGKLSTEAKGGSDTLTNKQPCTFFCFGSDTRYGVGKLEGEGAGAFAETGVTFRRLRKIPLALMLRADFPFYSMTRTTPTYDPDTATLTRTGPVRVYEVPLSLIFSVGF
jgi:hypothetical protein